MPGFLSDLLYEQPKAYWGPKLRGLLDAASLGAETMAGAQKPYTMEQAKTIGGLLADFTPGIGDAKSGYEGVQAARQGDWLGAGLGALGALPFVPNMAGMFIGKGAKTWDAVSMGKAADMEKAGADPRAIWSETGVWKGPDGQWRQEIPDNAARQLNQTGKAAEYMQDAGVASYPSTIGGVISHPKVFGAYDDLAKAHVTMENKVTGGAYSPNTPSGRSIMETFDLPMKHRDGKLVNADSAKSTTIHELQHAIQQREGWARGGSAEMFDSGPMFNESARDLTADLSRSLTGGLGARPDEIGSALKYADGTEVAAIAKKYGFNSIDDAMAFLKAEDVKRTPYGQYQRLAGEAEARATQARMNMDATQRRATFPADSYDVPLNQLIIRGLLGQ